MDQAFLNQLIAMLEQMLTLVRSQLQVSPPTHGPSSRPLAWGKKVSPEFKARVWWIAETLTQAQGKLFDANDLMACMHFETAGTFSASIKNPKSSATGLIQFMEATSRDVLKIPHKNLAKMTAEDQLNEVYKYFRWVIKTFGPVSGIADTYMAIFRPAAVGKPSETPLFVKGTDAYAVNTGLDNNKDGKIMKAEAAAKVAERLAQGMRPENYG